MSPYMPNPAKSANRKSADRNDAATHGVKKPQRGEGFWSPQLKQLPLALVTAAGLTLGLPGHAATIVVNDAGDTSSATLCTLRDAIKFMETGAISGITGCTNAGGAFGTADTITFGNAITTINLSNFELSFSPPAPSTPLLVQGEKGHSGITINAPGLIGQSILNQYGGNITLDGFTLTGGRGAVGGAVQVYGGFATGGARFELKNSTVTGNQASESGAGISADSGTANAVATVIITNSIVSNNQVQSSSPSPIGVQPSSDRSKVVASSLRGAGIYVSGVSVLTVADSTISGNGRTTDTAYGGGIFVNLGASATLSNTTVSGNASRCGGSGIHLQGTNSQPTTFSAQNSTVANNINGSEGLFCYGSGGLARFGYGGSITLNNTIMAGNGLSGNDRDIFSPVSDITMSGANNLIRNVSSTVTFTNAPLTSDPLLGPLQNNGGATFTHALLSGSPAIDAGGSTSLTNDQRGTGFQRVVGSAVDIGAFEVPINGACGPASSSTPVLSQPTSNLCSAGTATAVAGPQPFTWGCNGIGGGSTSTAATACSVPVQTWQVTPSVATGATSGSIDPSTAQTVNNNAATSFTLTPASGYAAGTATGCNGTLNGATYTTGAVTGPCNVVASFVLTPIDGVCGTANGVPAIAPPSSNLCSTGTVTSFTGGSAGPWAWSCAPIGVSSVTASCAAPIQQFTATATVPLGNGNVNAPSQTVNYNTATSFVLTPNAGYQIGSVSGCNGTLTGNTYNTGALLANCAVTANFTLVPINGSCGTANGVAAIAAPAANLCSTGTPSVTTGTGPWTWTCSPNATGTSTTNCAAPIQQLTATATINGGNGSVNTPSQTVNYNTATSFVLTPSAGYQIGSVSGCNGTLAGNIYTTTALLANCAVTASFTLGPVDGVCGSASSATPALSTPTANLCSTGTATAVSGTGPWSWGCNGNATGVSTAANACAVAIKTWAVTPSVSGGNGTIAPNTVVTVNNNGLTSFAVTPNAGYTIASVIGCGGALTGGNFATAAVTNDCAVVASFAAVARAALTVLGNSTVIANGDTTPALVDGTDFGAQTVGQSLVHSFVINNGGTARLTVNGMSFTGLNATDFVITSPTVFPVTVEANSTSNFSVRFTPSATGPRIATLVIATDDGAPTGAVTAPVFETASKQSKALLSVGFAVQGVGVLAEPALPVPTLGWAAQLASVLSLLVAGFAGLRRGRR
jgi:hypothetical protein